MQITLNKYEVSMGKKNYQIICPTLEIPDLYVLNTDVKGAIILGNESCLEKLSKLLLIVAESKENILFIRTSKNKLTEYLLNCWSIKEKTNDLVLLHHSIQLKINEWKKIRTLISKKNETKHEVLMVKDHGEVNRDLSKYWYREHKDFLDIREHFDTLFLIGSSDVFINISIDTKSVSEVGREVYLRHPGFHAHEHIDYYARKEYTKNFKYDGWSLSLDFYDSELWKI